MLADILVSHSLMHCSLLSLLLAAPFATVTIFTFFFPPFCSGYLRQWQHPSPAFTESSYLLQPLSVSLMVFDSQFCFFEGFLIFFFFNELFIKVSVFLDFNIFYFQNGRSHFAQPLQKSCQYCKKKRALKH